MASAPAPSRRITRTFGALPASNPPPPPPLKPQRVAGRRSTTHGHMYGCECMALKPRAFGRPGIKLGSEDGEDATVFRVEQGHWTPRRIDETHSTTESRHRPSNSEGVVQVARSCRITSAIAAAIDFVGGQTAFGGRYKQGLFLRAVWWGSAKSEADGAQGVGPERRNFMPTVSPLRDPADSLRGEQ